ncbi:MAG: T9SS type A sorting domain-containing protein [Chitinophagaceae bacterium]|nr:T9SS type A sorting domain-containing protein [Chitinophagaceae bacterium]
MKTVPFGIKKWSANQSISVYPNPSSGTFTITQTNVIPTKEGSVTAVVYDLLGRIVVRHQLAFKVNDAQITIQASKGNYILELIDSAGNTAHQQIVIE